MFKTLRVRKMAQSLKRKWGNCQKYHSQQSLAYAKAEKGLEYWPWVNQDYECEYRRNRPEKFSKNLKKSVGKLSIPEVDGSTYNVSNIYSPKRTSETGSTFGNAPATKNTTNELLKKKSNILDWTHRSKEKNGSCGIGGSKEAHKCKNREFALFNILYKWHLSYARHLDISIELTIIRQLPPRKT